ncbi:uncharacterized protein RSE6_03069 [Rhynchosporium secalis]|uniref:Uncharacterized protein n=1 Tax=Rhynchosporium secalis TaxID=38038 RepID=A0A1E1M1U2_RHYSE|nr:uncharacterized protein RSE6_03069 [Rhynchosporium secalis]
MQVNTLLFTAFMAAMVQPGLACTISQDCCWGGNDAGLNGCENQHTIDKAETCTSAPYVADYCRNNGVTRFQCDADCCSISGKVGRGCP